MAQRQGTDALSGQRHQEYTMHGQYNFLSEARRISAHPVSTSRSWGKSHSEYQSTGTISAHIDWRPNGSI
jgi:hypothetical protein